MRLYSHKHINMSKNSQDYIVAVKKGDKTASIFTTKVNAARYLGISIATFNRRISKSPYFEDDLMLIAMNCSLNKAKKGFARR